MIFMWFSNLDDDFPGAGLPAEALDGTLAAGKVVPSFHTM